MSALAIIRRPVAVLTVVLGGLAAGVLAAPSASAVPQPTLPHPRRNPWPVTVTVQTVPAMPGIRFAWDGTTLTTDATGKASVTSQHNFAGHALTVVDRAVDQPARRFRFTRWAGQRDPEQAFRTTVTGLPQRTNYTVTAGFAVQYPVTASFVDQYARPVDPVQISSVSLRDDTGGTVQLPSTGTIWLNGIVPVYGADTLRARPATYSVQTVTVSGSNTVDMGRQRYVPSSGQPLVVSTKFFNLTVRAHDLLRRASTGREAVVTFPDGSTRVVPFGADGSGTLHRVPRGIYLVDVPGSGSSLTSRVTLSRDVAVDVPVATRWNILVLAGSALALAGGLVLFGGRQRVLLRAIRTSTWRRALTIAGRAPRPPTDSSPEAVPTATVAAVAGPRAGASPGGPSSSGPFSRGRFSRGRSSEPPGIDA